MNGTLGQRLEVLSPSKRVLLEKRLGRPLGRPAAPSLISPREDRSLAPVSYNQEGLLFMEQLDPGTSRYNVVDAVRIRGSFDTDVVQRSLDAMARRHESLRTVFTESNGTWQQSILTNFNVPLRTVDVRISPLQERESAGLDALQNEADEPMDLSTGPLFSATLVTIDEHETLMLIKMHHVLSDGWSLGVFWNEFAETYSALVEGREPNLPALPIQFGDYAAWSRKHLERELERQTKYWTEQLDGAPAVLEMPTDRPRPAIQTSNGAQEVVHFPQDLLDGIFGLCKREGSTLYMVLVAAFNALLARYTGANDLIVGTPIAGRNRTETENLIGYFVNTLVLRSDLSGDPTFRGILADARSTVLDAFSHQELPFEKIVEAVRPERSLSYNPVYQVAFALQDAAGTKVRIPNAEIEPIKLGLTTSKFDLFLSVRETENGFTVTVEYNTDLFDKETIVRLISHYGHVLEAVVRDPGERLSELPILSDAERRKALVEWNSTRSAYPQAAVHRLFEQKAAEMPRHTAIVTHDLEITYEVLDEWSNKIANYLRHVGAKQGGRIGICFDRSPEMIAVTLGILKCGAAYVPIDPANPASRLSQIIDDSGLAFVVTNSQFKEAFAATDVTLIDVEHDREAIENSSADRLPIESNAEDVAYVMYTSGSTGTPKGALIPHKAIDRLVLNTDYISLSENDRIAHLSNVAFDAATFEIWGALLNGGCIVVFDKDLVLSPQKFAAEIKATGVTAMFLTTALFNVIAREVPDAFSTVRSVLTGGEQFDPASAQAVFAGGPPARLINVYGPTESTTFATWKEVTRDSLDRPTIPIGKPIFNTTVLLLDDALNPVPVGVVGEIFIGGDGLANGYLNRPELNDERFVDAPAHKISVSPLEGTPTRLYRTGDLAKYLPNGDIEYIGRKDTQVKIRGFRIELGEIESLIESHPQVSQSVVVAVRDARDHRMAAFYVPHSDTNIDAGDLKEYVRQKLPNYMVPAALIELPAFPINRNGKIDRRSLETRALSLEVAGTHAPADATDELELKLTWIWKEVLGVSSVGIHDNFFDLGGHSLAAVKVFSEIEKGLGCRLQLATLFHAPTIAELAQVIRDGGWAAKWRSLVPIRSAGTKAPFFCVHAVGGNILEYNELAHYLSADQPFYGLQSLGLEGSSEPLTDISSMAAAYVDEIRTLQPKGPYHLGGRSFGGTVAYEMARQLREAGEEIAMLAIFDSYPRGWQKLCSPELTREHERTFLKLRAERHLRIWLELRTLDKIRYAATKIGYKSRKLKNLGWRIVQKLRPPADSVGSRIRRIEEINYGAHRSYVPNTYEGKVTFFCAKEEVCPEENLTGWRLLAKGGVDVIDVPGDHQTMIRDPHVAVLAEKLEDALAYRDAGKETE